MAKINKENEALLPVPLLKELLRYEYETGLFYWIKMGRGRRGKKSVGSVNKKTGYLRIKINYRTYLAHRLAWAYVHGKYPSGEQPFIDHINGIPSDNRIANLKVSSGSENNRNAAIGSNNTSGIRGIWRIGSWNGSKTKKNWYWVTYWYDENGKGHQKKFNIEKLGEDEAKQMAITYRVEQIRLLEQNYGIVYSERHGT